MKNYSIYHHQNNNKCDESEILGFNAWSQNKNIISNLDTESTLFDYFIILFKKIKREIETDEMDISNLVKCDVDTMRGFQPWIDAIESSDSRENLINMGIEKANIYIESKLDNADIIVNKTDISNNKYIDISNN